MKLARRFNIPAEEEDLTQTQASVLGLVDGRGPIRLGDLAAAEHIHPTMLSRIVAKLAGRGLVQRRADPSDLRAAVVQITPAGHELHRKLLQRRAEDVLVAARRLTPQEAEYLLSALGALEKLAAVEEP